MATIIPTLSSKTDALGRSQILLRVTISRAVRFRMKSGLYISPSRFKDGRVTYPRSNPKEAEELRSIEKRLNDLMEFITDVCHGADPSTLSREYVEEALDRRNHPEKYIETEPEPQQSPSASFFELWDKCISDKKNLSVWRLKRYAVLRRSLARFEAYKRLYSPGFALDVETFDASLIAEYEAFLRDETEVYAKHPELYLHFPIDGRKAYKDRAPEPRGDNTIVADFSCLRAFFRWCMEQPDISLHSHPFKLYKSAPKENYGDPYFISIEERDTIADLDLDDRPELAVQRDIFIFHCLVGCRVSDLIRLTSANISEGFLQYIPQKTKAENVKPVRVPLHPRAVSLVEKYQGKDREGRLLPFITPQRYNDAIKKLFTRRDYSDCRCL